MSENKAIFDRYIQVANVLGQMFQNILEVVVHDFKDLDKAIIHIMNGHISGRSLGGPVSELNMHRLLGEDQFPDELVNYTSHNHRGQSLKSSSVAIRDQEGKIIGAFCLHFDISQFEQFQKFLDVFVNSKIHSLIGINDFGANQLLKYAGAGYLFYIGCKGFISSFKKQQTLDLCYAGNVTLLSPINALKQGFLTNLLNPKCALFFVSLFSQFIVVGTPLSLKIGFACINWSITLGWFLFLSYLITGNFIMSRIGSFRMYIDRVMGCVLMLLSLKLII